MTPDDIKWNEVTTMSTQLAAAEADTHIFAIAGTPNPDFPRPITGQVISDMWMRHIRTFYGPAVLEAVLKRRL